MRRNKAKKTKLVELLLILVLLISVGYAALTTNLQINGNATIKAQRWSVYFNNIVVDSNNSVASVTTAPTLSNNDTTITWEVSMDTPGQVYAFNVDVVNDGTIDAMVETATADIITSTLTDAQKKYLDYTIKYVNGAPIEQYDKLEAGETKTITVKLLFKNDETVNPGDLPSTEQTGISLSYSTNYIQADSRAVEKVTKLPLAIGDIVNYSTSLNGVTLDNWKVFYKEGDYTYIILDDYLPNVAVNITDIEKVNTYEVNTNVDRATFINAMATKTNWTSLLAGTLNGNSIDYSTTSDANIYAMGAPTVCLWVNSWNATYPSDTLYTATTDSAMADGLKGYYIGKSENPTLTYIGLSSKTGYGNTLYFPHQARVNDCDGYWFASPSATSTASGTRGVMGVDYAGRIYDSNYAYYDWAFRPVVCLPSNILE